MIFTENFNKYLLEINDEVSNRLINLCRDGVDTNIDSVDLHSDVGFVSYKKDGRNRSIKTRVGRLVSFLTDEFTARQIEVFTNSFKSIGEYEKIKERFEIGSGEDINWAYTTENYSVMSGSLNGSCMNNVGVTRLRLYTNNPRKIKVLMLKDERGKLLARAILWKNSFMRIGESAEDRNNAESIKGTIMDRVYSTKDFYNQVFIKYAMEKGWFIRLGGLSFKDPNGNDVKARIKSNLKNFEYDSYPYLDTMRSVSKKGTISNKTWKENLRYR